MTYDFFVPEGRCYVDDFLSINGDSVRSVTLISLWQKAHLPDAIRQR